MNTIKNILFILLILEIPLISSAEESCDIPKEVIEAIGKGDVETLSAHLNDNVELVVGTKNNVYSKRQAVGILTEFLKNNAPNKFKILHSGNKKTTSFLIGILDTSSGKYRVYVLTRKSDNKSVIQQIRIEKE